MAKVCFDGGYGVYVVRVASVLKVIYILVQTNVAPNAFRTSTIKPQCITKFAMDQVFDQPGRNVSITV